MEQARHLDDDRRVALLQLLGVFGTRREPVLELIAEGARLALEADAGFVSFVDEDLVWFKAAHGAQPHTLPRSQAFCDGVVKTSAPLVIEDVRANPATAHLDAGAYAGAPVFVRGQAVGTVCVTCRASRAFTEAQLAQLAVHDFFPRADLRKTIWALRRCGRP